MCVLFPIAYRRGTYSGVLSEEVEVTIPAALIKNTIKIPHGQGGSITGTLKQATTKQAPVAGSPYHLVLPPCR